MAKRFYLPEKVCKMCKLDDKVELAIQNVDTENDLITFKVLRDVKEPKTEKEEKKESFLEIEEEPKKESRLAWK